ncbi:MAG TPA: polymer-forming cytoskeletal protein [Terriglobales bacterium]|nr:polymer-forming cytoskeletal protein [Terriglobales bacterium]
MSTSLAGELAQIGKTVSIRGDISGNEDIYVDGQVEGSIQLNGNVLTVGPNGRIRANINAKSVIVSGTVEGNIQVTERTEMRKTAVVTGDVQTRRIAIEEGAYFKGKLEILHDSKAQTSPGTAAAASAVPSSPRSGTPEPTK